ncbi:MAG: DEAD/DEAH box helicase [Acidobacteriota bacterium]
MSDDSSAPTDFPNPSQPEPSATEASAPEATENLEFSEPQSVDSAASAPEAPEPAAAAEAPAPELQIEAPAERHPEAQSGPQSESGSESENEPQAGPQSAEASQASGSPPEPEGEKAGTSQGAAPPPDVFAELGLSPELLRAIRELGYEAPSSIQERAIPPLLAGRDVLGQAQTGTGKTAAFALPMLQRLDLEQRRVQVLVLTPTRELALQVAEAMKTYARYLRRFHIVPVYGGQSFDVQLRQLRRGPQVVVGTPGRLRDHLRRGTLDFGSLQAVVLDEADEMLRMGFQEEVENILEQTPPTRQVALFSATLPAPIRKVARTYQQDPVEVRVKAATATVSTVSQRYWPVSGVRKLDALTRILEVEDFDAMLVFVRTKVATVELAERLEARGFPSAPLNGDMAQSLRERTIERLKAKRLDIVVATDVAARGLDVERISHVVNFDIPYDVESYVHRIGRTARAGRDGKAILFVGHRERRMLQNIERVTGQRIEKMQLPSPEEVTGRRVQQFLETLSSALESEDLDFFVDLVRGYREQEDLDPDRLAGALAFLAQKERPLRPPKPTREEQRKERRERSDGPSTVSTPDGDEVEMTRYRVEVGRVHGVRPGHLVGAISNEAGLEGRYIGRITLFDNFSLVDLPTGMPREIFRHLQRVRVCGEELQIRPDDGPPGGPRGRGGDRPHRPRGEGRGGHPPHRGRPKGKGGPGGPRRGPRHDPDGFRPRRRKKPPGGRRS